MSIMTLKPVSKKSKTMSNAIAITIASTGIPKELNRIVKITVPAPGIGGRAIAQSGTINSVIRINDKVIST